MTVGTDTASNSTSVEPTNIQITLKKGDRDPSMALPRKNKNIVMKYPQVATVTETVRPLIHQV